MAFWLIFAWILTTVASLAFRPRPKNIFQPSPNGQFATPTAEEGRPIPWVCGSALVQGPQVLWFGDFDQVPIVQSGTQIGWQYYMGLVYGICMGPIDRVLDVRFDNKTLTVAPLSTASSVLRVKVGATTYSVTFAPGTYLTQQDAAIDYTNQLRAQVPDPGIRTVFGYEIKAGWNDTLYMTVAPTGGFPAWHTWSVALVLRPGAYDGAGLLAEIQYQTNLAAQAQLFIQGTPVPTPSWTYNVGTQQFTATAPNTFTATFDHTLSNALSTLGYSDLADLVVFNGPSTGNQTGQYRFYFTLTAGTEVHWTDVLTTAYALFGMTSAGPDFVASQRCLVDVTPAGEHTTINDFGAGTRITINAPTIFGGSVIAGEGGITGLMDVYHGSDTQPVDDYIAAKWGANAPALMGLCYATARKLYQGNSPQLKTVAFMVERCPNPPALGLTLGQHQIAIIGGIGFDANPACVIYEMLTNARWGLGIPAALVDAEAFASAAQTLYAEGLGISITVDSAEHALDLLGELSRHVDGAIYSDPVTGIISIRLVRADYRLEDLPVLQAPDVESVQLQRPAWDEVPNVVKIAFVDRASNHLARVAQVQNLAAIELAGRQIVQDVSYNGITNAAAAQLVAQRELNVLGFPAAKLSIVTNRKSWARRPVEPFILNWPKLGIAGQVCRVTRVRPGTLEDNRITIEAVEDPFGLGNATYSSIA